MSFTHGVLVPTCQHGNLHAFVSNIEAKAFDDTDVTCATETIDEAAILICRKSITGIGMTHIIPLRDFWRLCDDYQIDQLFGDAAKELFGNPTQHDLMMVGDLVMNSMDTLFNHPPEMTVLEQYKADQKEIEQLGLYMVVNDKVLVDAR